MKKIIAAILCLVCFMLPAPVFAEDTLPITVEINHRPVNFDVPPQIINDRTMVPMRAVFEMFGMSVEWNGETRTITASQNDKVIKMQIDSHVMLVSSEARYLDVPPTIVQDRTLVPVRAISEALGCKVDWDGETRKVTITANYPNRTNKYYPNTYMTYIKIPTYTSVVGVEPNSTEIDWMTGETTYCYPVWGMVEAATYLASLESVYGFTECSVEETGNMLTYVYEKGNSYFTVTYIGFKRELWVVIP